VLLYVGRMAGNKRIDLLVEALAVVKQHLPQTRLLLVGDDRTSPAYQEVVAGARRRAAELDVDQDVIWTGPVEDLAAHLRLADLYVTASLHEGFGVPLIEAMASGVPIVASRSGAMPWVLGDAGLTSNPGDAGDLAQKILSLLLDPALYQATADRGRERAQLYNLETYETKLIEILDQAMHYRLPRKSPPASTAESPEAQEEAGSPGERDRALLGLLAAEIQAASDVALRGYRVRSKVPLFGPLIAWVRRNLTSHLREPYLDPMVERQVALNHRAAEWFRRAGALLAGSVHRQTELEARVQALEAQVEALRHQVERTHDGEEARP